jgi:hypothetical protein
VGVLAVSLAVFVVCGDDSETGKTEETAPEEVVETTDSMLIEQALRETLTRWKYRDMAALYDMEFEYVRHENTYDDYLKHRRIEESFVDSFYDFHVTGLTYFRNDTMLEGPNENPRELDSVLIDDEAVFVGPTGDTSALENRHMVYYHRGRWVKPTIGDAKQQKEFDELMRMTYPDTAGE